MLVAAVLRPEDGDNGELEIVGRPPEQFPNAPEFPVGQTERPMKSLLRDRGQGASVSAGPDSSGTVDTGPTSLP